MRPSFDDVTVNEGDLLELICVTNDTLPTTSSHIKVPLLFLGDLSFQTTQLSSIFQHKSNYIIIIIIIKRRAITLESDSSSHICFFWRKNNNMLLHSWFKAACIAMTVFTLLKVWENMYCMLVLYDSVCNEMFGNSYLVF